jgi:hypothetical protein
MDAKSLTRFPNWFMVCLLPQMMARISMNKVTEIKSKITITS